MLVTVRRAHSTGTEAILSQNDDGWRVRINLREPNHKPTTIMGYLVPTLEMAKARADKEILKYGHVCDKSCKDWEVV